jgi:hypothetical protein
MCTPRIAQTLVRGIAGAREVVLEHSSHTPVLEETERYLDVVGRFMREAEGNDAPMADEEQQLIEEARKSREETEELRKESDAQVSGEPWAKTSSGDKDEITEDDA